MSERAPGFEDYIPSRLEWLALLLNSHLQYLDLPTINKMGIYRLYMPKSDGKTVALFVTYPKGIELDQIEDVIKTMIDQTKEFVEIYEWDAWVEIEVVRRPG